MPGPVPAADRCQEVERHPRQRGWPAPWTGGLGLEHQAWPLAQKGICISPCGWRLTQPLRYNDPFFTNT